MIRLDRPPVTPRRLLTKGQDREDQHKAEYDAHPEKFRSGKWTIRIDEKVYAAPAVKKQLVRMHHCKCCYCEKKLPRQQLDVEHFRPKGEVRQSLSHESQKPGYFWLAYRWDNLLLACHRCNRINKNNLFPLQNPAKRARSHHKKVEDEKPLIIDPGSQDPRCHIQFVNDTPVGRTKEGRETIKVLGLANADLRGKRIELLLLIDASISVLDAASISGDAEIKKKATKAREFLELAVKPQAEYSSMAIDYLAQHET